MENVELLVRKLTVGPCGTTQGIPPWSWAWRLVDFLRPVISSLAPSKTVPLPYRHLPARYPKYEISPSSITRAASLAVDDGLWKCLVSVSVVNHNRKRVWGGAFPKVWACCNTFSNPYRYFIRRYYYFHFTDKKNEIIQLISVWTLILPEFLFKKIIQMGH